MAETPDVVFKRECCLNATGISLPAREYLPGDGNHHFDFRSPMRQMRRGPKRLPMRCRRRKLQPGIPNTRSAAPLSDFFRTLFEALPQSLTLNGAPQPALRCCCLIVLASAGTLFRGALCRDGRAE